MSTGSGPGAAAGTGCRWSWGGGGDSRSCTVSASGASVPWDQCRGACGSSQGLGEAVPLPVVAQPAPLHHQGLGCCQHQAFSTWALDQGRAAWRGCLLQLVLLQRSAWSSGGFPLPNICSAWVLSSPRGPFGCLVLPWLCHGAVPPGPTAGQGWGLPHAGLIQGKLVGVQPRATQTQEAVQQTALHLCCNLS